MGTIVEEINNSLKKILEDLLNKKQENEKSLSKVNEKINEKVDEAKQYKIEVDNAKEQINILEEEITTLKTDLSDLNEKFGKKNLKAIVEAGNIEINDKIVEKQKEISKHRHKISELTEKARSIKDLLINLKKDKLSKEEKLENYTAGYNYYNESLTKIIDYAKNNPDNLTIRETNYDYLKPKFTDEEPMTEVFDEIESIDNDLNNKKEKIEDTKEIKKTEKLDDTEEVEEIKELVEEKDDSLEDNTDFLEKLKKASFELEDLEQTIDLEYNNIFGNNEEPKENNDNNELVENITSKELEENITSKELEEKEEVIEEEVIEEEVTEEDQTEDEKGLDHNFTVHPNIFDSDIDEKEIEDTKLPDIFGNNLISEEELNKEIPKIEDFFKSYAIDFNRFDNKMQKELEESFTPEMFKKTINVLVNNNIDLNNLYNASNIFIETSPIELEKIISKLLLAGQTTTNIGFVLSAITSITSVDLTDVINSYGPDIKNANITDLIIKAKNISEVGKSE